MSREEIHHPHPSDLINGKQKLYQNEYSESFAPALQGTVFTTKFDKLLGWARKYSLFQYPFVTACCGMEYMAVASAQTDYPRATLVAINPGWVKTDLGGTGAPMMVDQSVAVMRQTLAGLTRRHKGAFLNYDGRRYKTW